MVVSPKVIVLILSYNGRDLLSEAISSYQANEYDNYDIVVIDNGSDDKTQEFVQNNYPDVSVLRLKKNRGYSGGFNHGLEYAFIDQGADYVLVTNNDVKADANIISELVKTALEKKDAGFVIGKVYFYDHPHILQSVGKLHDDRLWSMGHIGGGEVDNGKYDQVEVREWCDDIYWLIRSELYKQTGGYDTEFQFQAEDYDWQVRAKKAGWKIYYTPKAKLWHKDSMTIGKHSAFKAYYDFRNPLIVQIKHREFKEYKYYLWEKIKYLLIVIVKKTIQFEFEYIVKSISGLFSALKWGITNNRCRLDRRHD
jgi:GT2 family glycosyltransferase